MENLTSKRVWSQVKVPVEGEHINAQVEGPNKGPVRPGYQGLVDRVGAITEGSIYLKAITVDPLLLEDPVAPPSPPGSISATGTIFTNDRFEGPRVVLTQGGAQNTLPCPAIPEGTYRSDDSPFVRGVFSANVADGASCFARGRNVFSATRVAAGVYTILTSNCPALYLGLADNTFLPNVEIHGTRSKAVASPMATIMATAFKVGAAGDPASKLRIEVEIRDHNNALVGDGHFSLRLYL